MNKIKWERNLNILLQKKKTKDSNARNEEQKIHKAYKKTNKMTKVSPLLVITLNIMDQTLQSKDRLSEWIKDT